MMHTLLLIALALIPAPIIFYFITRGMVITKAKWILIGVISLLAGVSIPLVYYVQLGGVTYVPFFKIYEQPYATFTTLFLVGPSEELAKFLPVFFLVWKSREFKNVYDGILFSSAMAIAFATIENVTYCLHLGLGAAIARIFLSVPLHVAFGAYMGYFLGKARMTTDHKLAYQYLLKGIVSVSLLHGMVDGMLLWSVNVRLFGAYIFIPLILFFMIRMVRVERRKLSPNFI